MSSKIPNKLPGQEGPQRRFEKKAEQGDLGTHKVEVRSKGSEDVWIIRVFKKIIAIFTSIFSKKEPHEFKKVESLLAKTTLTKDDASDFKAEIVVLLNLRSPLPRIRPLLERYVAKIKVPSVKDDYFESILALDQGISQIEDFCEGCKLDPELLNILEDKKNELVKSKQTLIEHLEIETQKAEENLVPENRIGIDPRTDILFKLTELEKSIRMTELPSEEKPKKKLDSLLEESKKMLESARNEEAEKTTLARNISTRIETLRTSVNQSIQKMQMAIELLKGYVDQTEFKRVTKEIQDSEKALKALTPGSNEYKEKKLELETLEIRKMALEQKNKITQTVTNLSGIIRKIGELGKEEDLFALRNQVLTIENQLERLQSSVDEFVEKWKGINSENQLDPFIKKKIQLLQSLADSQELERILRGYSDAKSSVEKKGFIDRYYALEEKRLPPEKFKELNKKEAEEFFKNKGAIEQRLQLERSIQGHKTKQLEQINGILNLDVSFQDHMEEMVSSAKNIAFLKQKTLPSLLDESQKAYELLSKARTKRVELDAASVRLDELKKESDKLAIDFVIGAKSKGNLKKFIKIYVALALLQDMPKEKLKESILERLDAQLLIPRDKSFQKQLEGYIDEDLASLRLAA